MSGEPEVLWRGKFLRIMKSGRWEYADRVGATGAVVIVGVTDGGHMIMTEQFRIPVNQRVIELPAGIAGDIPGQEGEELAIAARRELLEEAGYEAFGMELLFPGPPSAGLASEVVTFFKATGLRKVAKGGGEGHEDITVHEIPLSEIDAWLRRKSADGLLVDPKVYTGLYFVTRDR
jgi:ADP-ribose pyrophosphatase